MLFCEVYKEIVFKEYVNDQIILHACEEDQLSIKEN